MNNNIFGCIFTCQTIAIACGYVLDLIIGDPHWLYHPVRLIGKLISWLEGILLKEEYSQAKKYKRGIVLAVLIPLITGIVTAGILAVCYYINIVLGCVVETIMCYQILAVKSLKTESMKVYYALKNEGIPQARQAVSMIVGRDTSQLDEHGFTRAAVETVAENTSDGVVAPLFYMMFFGAGGGFVYKAVNTMDSMIGYKNDKYLYFGRCAAKLDDVANYIPARLSGWLMVAASAFVKMDVKNAAKIYRRDRRNHASPYSAQTEAAMAGALEVQLAGNAYYFGKLYEKPTIGDGIRPVEVEDIRRSNRLLYATAILGAVIFLLIGSAVRYCFFL